MRILVVTNMFPTERDLTFGTFVADQVRALRAHREIERCEVMFVDGRASRWSYALAPMRLAATVRRGAFDVVLAHYGLTGAIAVTQRRLPVVITYHGGDLLETRRERTVSRLAYHFAKDAISVSLAGLARLPGPAHHLTCGIDLRLFRPTSRSAARRTFGVEEGELAILFPSSPARAEKMYPRFTAVRDHLRRRGHRVHELLLRDLPRERVPEIMAAADVMLLTSRREATPVSVMEALACGLPVVATPVGDVPTMLADAGHARVVPFAVGTFADAVEDLVAGAPEARVADPASLRFEEDTLTNRLVAILSAAAAASGGKVSRAPRARRRTRSASPPPRAQS